MANTFPLFSNLKCPTEIQDLIWHHFIAMTEPRTIEMRIRKSEKPSGTNSLFYAYFSPETIPAVLHVSAQSRAAAKKRWKIAFSNRSREHGIWVDFETDTLAFRSDAYFSRPVPQPPKNSMVQFYFHSTTEEKSQIRRVLLDWASLFSNPTMPAEVRYLAHR